MSEDVSFLLPQIKLSLMELVEPMETGFNGDLYLPSPQPPTTFSLLNFFSLLSIYSSLSASSFQPIIIAPIYLLMTSLLLFARSKPKILSLSADSVLRPLLSPSSILWLASSRLWRGLPLCFGVMMDWEIFSPLRILYFPSICFSNSIVDLISSIYSSRPKKVMMKQSMSSLTYSSWIEKIMMGYARFGFDYTRLLVDYSFHFLIYSFGIRKVLTPPLRTLYLPTTSYNYTVKGHSNSHGSRVYKYPLLVAFSNQVLLGLGIEVLYFSFQIVKVRSGFNCNTNTACFCFCGMGSSPRSVLEPSFQCEAVPICLAQRSSSSLENALRRTLAGRLLTAKRPSITNLTLAVSRLWNCVHRVSCYDHGKCLYSFEFTYGPDVERVVSGGPWYVNGDMLLISRMNPSQSIEQLPFSFAKLWVRCYDLPPMCFTKEYAEAIGNSLGKFCETDLPPEDPDEALLLVQKFPTVRKYLRVKIDFNLYGPLKSTQSIKIYNDEKVVVAEYVSRLTYERLPHVCLRCGFLGHLIEGCSFEGPQLYGEWIRAERFFRINFRNSDIPKAVVTSKEGLPSSSSAGNEVTQVSNIAELVNTMVNDPGIVKANYSHAREEGPLPIPKGKGPAIDIPQISSLVPYSSTSPPKNLSSTVFGTSGDSILGTVPSFLRSHSSPMGSDLMDGDDGQFASYLNSIASYDEAYAPNANRCLFKLDAPIPVGSSSIKGLNSSSPINTGETLANKNKKDVAQLSEVFNTNFGSSQFASVQRVIPKPPDPSEDASPPTPKIQDKADVGSYRGHLVAYVQL